MSACKVPKRLKSVVEAAEAVGWTFGMTKNSHYRLTPPAGWQTPDPGIPVQPVLFAGSPSDHRGDKNSFALLKRQGVRF